MSQDTNTIGPDKPNYVAMPQQINGPWYYACPVLGDGCIDIFYNSGTGYNPEEIETMNGIIFCGRFSSETITAFLEIFNETHSPDAEGPEPPEFN